MSASAGEVARPTCASEGCFSIRRVEVALLEASASPALRIFREALLLSGRRFGLTLSKLEQCVLKGPVVSTRWSTATGMLPLHFPDWIDRLIRASHEFLGQRH